MKNSKVDLNLLKRLVAELQGALDKAESFPKNEDSHTDYVVEMSKAMGIASAVIQESSLLVMDIGSALQPQGVGSKQESLGKILSTLKKPGNPGDAN